jgi:hypothetical protein
MKKHPGRVRFKIMLIDQGERLKIQMTTTEKGIEMNDEMADYLNNNPLFDVHVDTV